MDEKAKAFLEDVAKHDSPIKERRRLIFKGEPGVALVAGLTNSDLNTLLSRHHNLLWAADTGDDLPSASTLLEKERNEAAAQYAGISDEDLDLLCKVGKLDGGYSLRWVYLGNCALQVRAPLGDLEIVIEGTHAKSSIELVMLPGYFRVEPHKLLAEKGRRNSLKPAPLTPEESELWKKIIECEDSSYYEMTVAFAGRSYVSYFNETDLVQLFGRNAQIRIYNGALYNVEPHLTLGEIENIRSTKAEENPIKLHVMTDQHMLDWFKLVGSPSADEMSTIVFGGRSYWSVFDFDKLQSLANAMGAKVLKGYVETPEPRVTEEELLKIHRLGEQKRQEDEVWIEAHSREDLSQPELSVFCGTRWVNIRIDRSAFFEWLMENRLDKASVKFGIVAPANQHTLTTEERAKYSAIARARKEETLKKERERPLTDKEIGFWARIFAEERGTKDRIVIRIGPTHRAGWFNEDHFDDLIDELNDENIGWAWDLDSEYKASDYNTRPLTDSEKTRIDKWSSENPTMSEEEIEAWAKLQASSSPKLPRILVRINGTRAVGCFNTKDVGELNNSGELGFVSWASDTNWSNIVDNTRTWTAGDRKAIEARAAELAKSSVKPMKPGEIAMWRKLVKSISPENTERVIRIRGTRRVGRFSEEAIQVLEDEFNEGEYDYDQRVDFSNIVSCSREWTDEECDEILSVLPEKPQSPDDAERTQILSDACWIKILSESTRGNDHCDVMVNGQWIRRYLDHAKVREILDAAVGVTVDSSKNWTFEPGRVWLDQDEVARLQAAASKADAAANFIQRTAEGGTFAGGANLPTISHEELKKVADKMESVRVCGELPKNLIPGLYCVITRSSDKGERVESFSREADKSMAAWELIVTHFPDHGHTPGTQFLDSGSRRIELKCPELGIHIERQCLDREIEQVLASLVAEYPASERFLVGPNSSAEFLELVKREKGLRGENKLKEAWMASNSWALAFSQIVPQSVQALHENKASELPDIDYALARGTKEMEVQIEAQWINAINRPELASWTIVGPNRSGFRSLRNKSNHNEWTGHATVVTQDPARIPTISAHEFENIKAVASAWKEASSEYPHFSVWRAKFPGIGATGTVLEKLVENQENNKEENMENKSSKIEKTLLMAKRGGARSAIKFINEEFAKHSPKAVSEEHRASVSAFLNSEFGQSMIALMQLGILGLAAESGMVPEKAVATLEFIQEELGATGFHLLIEAAKHAAESPIGKLLETVGVSHAQLAEAAGVPVKARVPSELTEPVEATHDSALALQSAIKQASKA